MQTHENSEATKACHEASKIGSERVKGQADTFKTDDDMFFILGDSSIAECSHLKKEQGSIVHSAWHPGTQVPAIRETGK